MTKFAFLVNPDTTERLLFILDQYTSFFRKINGYRFKALIPRIPPFVFANINLKKYNVEGMLILCPLLPDQFVGLNRKVVLDKIRNGVNLAKKKGAKIVGLGGFTSIFSNQGEDLLDIQNVFLTTGNSFTANLAIKGVIKACSLLGYNLSDCNVMVVGAGGDIGSVCSKYFYQKSKKMILVGRDLAKINNLKDSMQILTNEIIITNDINTYAPIADVIITATSATTTIIDVNKLKRGSIVCDISLPPNLARNIYKMRNDVFAFEGGHASFPDFDLINQNSFKRLFPYKSIFGCLAETILLSLDQKFDNFSLGRGNISLEKIDEIDMLGRKYNLSVSPFFCGDRICNFNIFKNFKITL